jgi:hypothetical protein
MRFELTILPGGGGRLASLEPLIESWVTVLENFSTQVVGDRPWWYRERTQVGFLAVAAWRSGAIALEEWRTTKNKNDVPAYGRNDLWIQWKSGNLFVEAKHCWCDIFKSNDVSEKQMTNCLSDAQKSTSEIQIPDGDGPSQILAAAFVSPIWKETSRSLNASRDEGIRDWKRSVQKLVEKGSAHLAAIVEEKLPFKVKESGNEFVGCALLLYDVT